MMKSRTGKLVGLAALLCLGLAGCSAAPATEEPVSTTSPRVTSGPVTLQAMAEFSSTTLDDWQAYADAIVVAKVVDEKRLPQAKSETVTGEGLDLIGRTIQVDVLKQLWMAPDVKAELGGSLTMDAAGWLEEPEKSVEVVAGGGSRLEPGHEYVMALRWWPEIQSEGDATQPAAWGPVGADAVLPADGGLIGSGEYLGVEAKVLDRTQVPEGSVLAEHLGQSVEEFAQSISDFHRVEREPVVEEPGGGGSASEEGNPS